MGNSCQAPFSDVHIPNALGPPRGEGGRVLQGGVSTPCGENRAVWGPRSPGHKNFSPESLGAEFRGGATVRMVMVVADADAASECAVNHPIRRKPRRMGTPEKKQEEPPWFGPSLFGQSTTRNMVGASVESSIPSDITGKTASPWPTADTPNQRISSLSLALCLCGEIVPDLH